MSVSAKDAARRRQRREQRIRENFDRISAALGTTDSVRFATRNPTRVIPDVPGMHEATKEEVRKDRKEIERLSELLVSTNSKDEELMTQRIRRSIRPAVHPDSHLERRLARLVQWVENPATIENDLSQSRKRRAEAHEHLANLETTRQRWFTTFERARKSVIELTTEVGEKNRRLKAHGETLSNLLKNEVGGGAGGRGGFSSRELVEMLADYEEKLVSILHETGTVAEKITPFITMSIAEIGELEAPSKEWLRGKKIVKDDTTNSVEATVKDEVESSVAVNVAEDETSPEAKEPVSEDVVSVSAEESRSAAARELTSSLSNLRELVSRVESAETDVDWFFGEGADCLESMVSRSLGITGNGKKVASSKSDNVNEQSTLFETLMNDPNLWKNHMNSVLSAIDPVPSTTGSATRKKKSGSRGAEVLSMRTFARGRMEYGLPVLLTPLSRFEDRYIGTLNFPTKFRRVESTNDKNGEAEWEVFNPMPPHLRSLEDEALDRLHVQSCAAATSLKLRNLRKEVAELEAELSTSLSTATKSETLLATVRSEEASDLEKIHADLIRQGLIPAPPAKPASEDEPST